MRKIYLTLAMCLICSLTGCASLGTYNPATGKNEFIFISTEEEVAMGNDIHKKLQSEFTFSTDYTLTRKVEDIGYKIAAVSDRQDYQYEFFVIDKDELNAFTVPGGKIYLFTGLLNKFTSDAQIASVIAHEVGHCAARHTVKKFQAALGYNLVGSIILGQLGSEQAMKVAQLGTNTVMQLVFASYGRQDEHESDQLGLKYMYEAGYNLQGMIESFKILQAESREKGMLDIFRTHPYIEERINAVQSEIERIRALDKLYPGQVFRRDQ